MNSHMLVSVMAICTQFVCSYDFVNIYVITELFRIGSQGDSNNLQNVQCSMSLFKLAIWSAMVCNCTICSYSTAVR